MGVLDLADRTQPLGGAVHNLGASTVAQYKKGEVPQGAVPITRSQVLKMQQDVITKWQPSSEMWALKQGSSLCAGLAVSSGIVFNNHFRRQFKLLTHARMASYMPTTVIPAATAFLVHHLAVSEPILTRDLTCATCGEVRSASLQVLIGVVQPYVLSVLACLALARQKYTIPIPQTKDLGSMWPFLKKMSRPVHSSVLVLLAANIVGAAWIVGQEGKAAHRVWRKMGMLSQGDIDQMAQKSDDL